MSRRQNRRQRNGRQQLEQSLRNALVACVVNAIRGDLGTDRLGTLVKSNRRLSDLVTALMATRTVVSVFADKRFAALGIAQRRRNAWMREAVRRAHDAAYNRRFMPTAV